MSTQPTIDADVPPDQRAAFQAWLTAWKCDLAPRNRLETFLAERAARTAWKIQEADKVEAARAAHHARTAPLEEKKRHIDEVIRIGHELVDPATDEWMRNNPMWTGRDPGKNPSPSPMTPERALHLLMSSPEGCGWLRERWEELAQLMRARLTWGPADERKAIRLLGMTPDVEDNDDIRELRLTVISFNGNHSQQVIPEGKSVPSREEAQAYLLALCARMDDRLRERQEELKVEISPLEAGRHDFDATDAGKELRRHQATLHRELLKMLETLTKLKKTPASREPSGRVDEMGPPSSPDRYSTRGSRPRRNSNVGRAVHADSLGTACTAHLTRGPRGRRLPNDARGLAPPARQKHFNDRTMSLNSEEQRQSFDGDPECRAHRRRPRRHRPAPSR